MKTTAFLLCLTGYGGNAYLLWPRLHVVSRPVSGTLICKRGSSSRAECSTITSLHAAPNENSAGEKPSLSSMRANPNQIRTEDEEETELYEESFNFADKNAVAQEVILEITSSSHFEDVISRAAGAEDDNPGGYEDAKGRWRRPHKLVVVSVYASWCRACKGLQPKLLKLMKRHPEVLCLKLNKGQHEELAARLGVRGLPTLILYKKGKRIDHFTTANIETIEDALIDNT